MHETVGISFGAALLGAHLIQVFILNDLRNDLELNRSRGRHGVRDLHAFVQHDLDGGGVKGASEDGTHRHVASEARRFDVGEHAWARRVT